MPSKKKPTGPSRRTLMPLTGTHRNITAGLSFEALAALHLTSAHLARASQLRPTTSAVVRAAILHYCRHLEMSTPTDHTRESAYVLSTSKALRRADLEDADRTLAGLEAAGEEALPSLADVIRPSGLNHAGFEARYLETLRAIGPRRFKHG